MDLPLDGGCLCGAIRYRVHAEPLTVYACHCTDCQRRTGSAFAISLVLARDALELASGDPFFYRAIMHDGRVKQGRICAACGCRLWGEPANAPALVVIQPGSLDDTSWLRPVAHIWTRSAQRWLVLPSDAQPTSVTHIDLPASPLASMTLRAPLTRLTTPLGLPE